MSAPPDISCANCPYFRSPSAPIGGGWVGVCQRFPQFQPKNPDQVCGEHPNWVVQAPVVKNTLPGALKERDDKAKHAAHEAKRGEPKHGENRHG